MIVRAGLPNVVAAAGATFSRIQPVTASAIGQRSVAAGASPTRCPFSSTTSSRRTTSSAPQEPGPVIEGSACATAMSGVRRARHAEGAGGGAPATSGAAAAGGAVAPAMGAGVTSVRVFGASERVRELALPWLDCSCARTPFVARAPGPAARTDGWDGASLGRGVTRLWCERRSSVDWDSIAARASRISAAMALIATKPDTTVSIPRRAIKGLDLLPAL